MKIATQPADAKIARAFHEAYERLAPDYGYETRIETAVAWESLPEANRELMTGVVADMRRRGVIR